MSPSRSAPRTPARSRARGDGSVPCPRCGYDQRGGAGAAADATMNACPLTGTCVECGLAFHWGDLLNPRLRRPRWCVEYGPLRSFPLRVATTLALTFAPWWFFRSLRLHHEPRFGRLATYLVVLAALAYAGFAVVHAGLAWRQWSVQRAGINVVQHDPRLLGLRRPTRTTVYASGVSAPRAILHAMLRPWSVVSPGPLRPVSRPAPPNAPERRVRSRWSRATGFAPPPATLPHEPPRVLFGRYPGVPRELMPRAALGEVALGRTTVLLLLCAHPLLVLGFSVLFFAVLPVSRRRARVRWAHLVRIGAYGAGLLGPLAAVVLAGPLVGSPQRGLDAAWFRVVIVLALLVVPALLVPWWWTANSSYLRVRHGLGVAIAAVLVAVLLSAVCGYSWFWIRVLGVLA